MAEQFSPITFVILHDPTARQSEHPGVPKGWRARQYVISAARGAAAPQPERVELPPDAVVEITLEDGSQLLVAAEDAQRYLGVPERGEGDGAIRVGPTLRFGDASRDGISQWFIKSLRIFDEGPSGMTALVLAGAFQDKMLEHRVGLFRCGTDRFELVPVATIERSNRPTLLFIHGTASSTRGSFGALWESARVREGLFANYGDRVYAFEHRTLTEDPATNAMDLVRCVPEGTVLHIVSHSRGGLVGELLARAGRKGTKPFSDDDLAYYKNRSAKNGRDERGTDEAVRRLTELGRELVNRGIKIERFVRVACPARGTTLVSGRLDRWASTMLNLLRLAIETTPFTTPAAEVFDAGKSFLLQVVKERTNARVMPGLEAMMPESPLVAMLNRPDVEVEQPVHVIAGDFLGSSILKRLGDWLSERFYGGQNDLVVNTPSMTGGANRTQGVWQALFREPGVHHLSYFKREESAGRVVSALAGSDAGFTRLAGPNRQEIARAGRRLVAQKDQPIALVLPGIMGSHLAIGGDRIWFDPLDMIAGEMARLEVTAPGVVPQDLIGRAYDALCEYLEQTHDVRRCPYDWRLSILTAAERFVDTLDKALEDARERKKPVRIIAHSTGGLVARAALVKNGRWQRLADLPGSRVVQLGTPNNGSHFIAEVLLGRDAFVRLIERWFNWRHDLREFLKIVAQFPGVLELLPCSEEGDGLYEFGAWEKLHNADRTGPAWVLPTRNDLRAAAETWTHLAAAPLDPALTVYVAGKAERTPVGIVVAGDRVEIEYTPEGDGRVPWKTGIPPGVPTWYMDAVHGEMCVHRPAFEAFAELLDRGRTSLLPTTPPTTRGGVCREVLPEAAPILLYPSVEEVEAAMFGITPRPEPTVPTRRISVRVVHGNLANSDAPVVVGHYAYDGVVGTADYLDRLLDGRLKESLRLGTYPSEIADSAVFMQTDRRRKPAGAIVVGLGQVGSLSPGELQRTLTRGLLRYASDDCILQGAEGQLLAVGAVLVGTGFGGVEISESVIALLRAAHAVNSALEQREERRRRFIGNIVIYEEALDRASAGGASRGAGRHRPPAGRSD